MHDHYPASHLALDAAELEMLSARPDAPVVAPRIRRVVGAGLRARAASSLRRVAAALEPAPARAPRPDRRLGGRVEPSTACR